MVSITDHRFDDLDYEAFRALAGDPGLSRHEKVGFPDSYREGREEAIFHDVVAKLASLQRPGARVIEVGPGCSRMPVMLAERCAEMRSELTWVDSAEMLALLPDAPHVHKVAGRFPQALQPRLHELTGGVDTIVAYSVVQYVFGEGNLYQFLDTCLALLASGGELLIGDVPNQTMRKRFFASPAGVATHRRHTGSSAVPEVHFNRLEPGQMDDSVVLAVLARARAQGFHAWVVPQAVSLPMANRREDILIRCP
ncbi:MAG TPA: SAM-dependent methyltransferase [Burkholderiaceae bacterium]|nr:SAM-dependent methyltransferase [Burkholderiaceae bacterium]